MPAPKKAEAQQPPASNEPMYPVIEALVERASADELNAFFTGVKGELAALKGPKADQGKKAKAAIERTEELLSYLLEVREKLEASKKSAPKGRR